MALRGWVLYLAVGLVFAVSLNRDQVSRRRLDFYQDAPQYLLELAGGRAAADHDRLLTARSFFAEYTRLFPEDIGGITSLAYTYYRMDELRRAEALYRKAALRWPGDSGIRYNLVMVAYRARQSPQVAGALRDFFAVAAVDHGEVRQGVLVFSPLGEMVGPSYSTEPLARLLAVVQDRAAREEWDKDVGTPGLFYYHSRVL